MLSLPFLAIILLFFSLCSPSLPLSPVKLSNLHRVLANDQIAEPSAVEAKAKTQAEKRKLAHLMHNESRKLTAEQKKEKMKKKLKEDTSLETHVAVFRSAASRLANLLSLSHSVFAAVTSVSLVCLVFLSCDIAHPFFTSFF